MNLLTDIPRSVKECVGDMLDVVEDLECTTEFALESYLIAAKYRELIPTGCNHPSPEIVCEYCGDNSDHVRCVRGGGGLDKLSVTWDGGIQTGNFGTFISCQSCCQDEEKLWETIHGRQREDICIGCGIHTNLKGDEGTEPLNPVWLHFEDSEGISSTDYYFCSACLRGSHTHSWRIYRATQSLEELVIDRIQGFRSFIGEEGSEIKIPEGGDYWRDIRRVLFSESSESSSDEELDEELLVLETYDGEYENEELPENNTEKASEIKGAIKEVGEKMFDLQEQLKEGDYLEIMNLLQKVTNKVNSL